MVITPQELRAREVSEGWPADHLREVYWGTLSQCGSTAYRIQDTQTGKNNI
jgi:hypothetical protein